MDSISPISPRTPTAYAPTVAATGRAAAVAAERHGASQGDGTPTSPSYKLSISADGLARGRAADTPAAKSSETPEARQRAEDGRRAEAERLAAEQAEARQRDRAADDVRWTLSDDRSSVVLERTDPYTHQVTMLAEMALLGARARRTEGASTAAAADTKTPGADGRVEATVPRTAG